MLSCVYTDVQPSRNQWRVRVYESRNALRMQRARQLVGPLLVTLLILVFGVMVHAPFARAASSCDYYASPSGTGTGLSPSTPFKIKDFWSVAAPGKILCLLDGTYTGQGNQIISPAKLSGTSGKPITVRALNDGQVHIDATGFHRAVDIQGNYFTLEGINASHANNHVIVIRGNHNIVRRVVAWNAGMGGVDSQVFRIAGGFNLVEDAASFGRGRKHFDSAQGGNDNTFRRVFCRFEERVPNLVGPQTCMTLFYNHYRLTLENAIFSRNDVNEKQVHQNEALYSGDGGVTGGNTYYQADSRVLGSIGYVFGTDIYVGGGIFGLAHPDSFEVKHFVGYVEPGFHSSKRAFSLNNGSGPGPKNLRISHSVGIAPSPSMIGSVWTKTNVRLGTTLDNAIGKGNSIFQVVPGICKRYINGVLTDKALWPWPMNQRIKEAMIQAGRAPVDVTQTIEKIFGPIPSACRTDIQDPGKPPAPHLRIGSR